MNFSWRHTADFDARQSAVVAVSVLANFASVVPMTAVEARHPVYPPNDPVPPADKSSRGHNRADIAVHVSSASRDRGARPHSIRRRSDARSIDDRRHQPIRTAHRSSVRGIPARSLATPRRIASSSANRSVSTPVPKRHSGCKFHRFRRSAKSRPPAAWTRCSQVGDDVPVASRRAESSRHRGWFHSVEMNRT